jgi:hypothetical protein
MVAGISAHPPMLVKTTTWCREVLVVIFTADSKPEVNQSTWQDELMERLGAHLTLTGTDQTVKQELSIDDSWMHQFPCPCECDQRRIGLHLRFKELTQMQ